MKYFLIPKSLHEVFGEKQSLIEIACTAMFALVGSLLIYLQLYRPIAHENIWMIVLGFVLVADVLAGCIANFSQGTNKFYSERPKGRLLFIAIHIHILAIAWLLSAPLDYALLIWAYTIISALVVNALKGSHFQLFISASLMCSGLLVLMLFPLSTWFLIVSTFFMIKVMFSFAVDHYGYRV
ncbi:hypothetical protein CGT94_17210 [Vibrio metoecus]|uniref:hypothetical protein n=1 Tax=Vibrio metoecus TaxID=1481663 RepID=UPI0006D8500F|nr:hypothetical protein [Vibrio metoecus]KQB05454.1 hypothetical protein XV93_12110 [Vibrio metoecus]PAR47310.1 hypothetical protein CGT94_17210 [Vibrio metoecus]